VRNVGECEGQSLGGTGPVAAADLSHAGSTDISHAC
jgi:hypothetical protein